MTSLNRRREGESEGPPFKPLNRGKYGEWFKQVRISKGGSKGRDVSRGRGMGGRKHQLIPLKVLLRVEKIFTFL